MEARVLRPRLIAVAVGLLALLSAVAALVLSETVFPHLSVDNDEPIYRLHADALAHGHLFVPAPDPPGAFRPWLAAVRGDHYVLKYSFLYPALLAASRVLVGGTWLALALVAAGTVVMAYLLAREVLGREGEALLAAGLVALSPLILVQSALHLAYLPTLLLLEIFGWGLLRGLSTGRNRLLALAGLALGLAFALRPYDAVLFALPLLAWALFRRVGARPSPGAVVAFLLPTGVGLACLLAWNAAATGHPLRLPFAVLEPDDNLGFGIRRMYPTDSGHRFGLAQGLNGVIRHGLLLAWWVAGGAVLVVLAVIAYLRAPARSAARALGAIAAVVPLGYVFFWGTWNATVLWRGVRYVGPFYFLPLVVPIAVLGARALSDVRRWRPAAGVAGGLMVLWSTGVTMFLAVDDNLAFTRHNQALVDLVSRPGGPDKLVYAAMPTPFLMHPSPVITNRWDLSGPVVYALARGQGDLDVARRHQNRTAYRLDVAAAYLEPDEPFSARLERLDRVAGVAGLELDVVARWGTAPGPLELVVIAEGRARAYPLDPAGGAERREHLVVTARGAEVAGRTAAAEWTEKDTGAGLVVRLRRLPQGRRAVVLAEERVPLRSDGTVLEMLVPDGRAWTAGRPTLPALEVSRS